MNTRYSRPLHRGLGACNAAWYALPALLLAAGLGLAALLGSAPDAPPPRAETATELPSLPPAA